MNLPPNLQETQTNLYRVSSIAIDQLYVDDLKSLYNNVTTQRLGGEFEIGNT